MMDLGTLYFFVCGNSFLVAPLLHFQTGFKVGVSVSKNSIVEGVSDRYGCETTYNDYSTDNFSDSFQTNEEVEERLWNI